MQQELKEGLYNLNSSKKWLIKVNNKKWLFVGTETDCRLTMNDIAENYGNDKNYVGSMKELKSLSI